VVIVGAHLLVTGAVSTAADLAAGNVVGSCSFNVLGVLSVAEVVTPISVGPAAFRGALSRPEGAVLVALNALDWVVAFLGR
jgi:cation:H+ antiporter